MNITNIPEIILGRCGAGSGDKKVQAYNFA